MKRKLLSLILVAAMLASMLIFVPTASATESKATFEFGDAVGTANETVTVDFKVTTDALAGVQFMFEYDASRLTFDGIEWTTECGGAGFPVDLTANTVLGPLFTAQGPYRILGWATGIGVGAVDLSAGVVMATLTFTIKEDAPLGDAKVAFAPLYTDYGEGKADPNFVDTGAGIYYENHDGAVTFVDGKVTVLPEGYSSESTLVVHEITQDEVDSGALTYSYLDDYSGVVITGYTTTHDGAVLVLPSVINDENTLAEYFGDLPVVGIASKAFTLRKEAAVVIPESVTDIAVGAFFNCTIADYYVLNPDCEIGAGAMGTFGACNGTSWTNGPYAKPLDTAKTQTATIHGVAGSTAAAYAGAVYTVRDGLDRLNYSADMNLPAEHVLSFGGNDYYFKAGTTATAPGVAEVNDQTVIAWTDGTNTYAPGASIVVDKDIALEPVTITAPQTATDVDFKLSAGEAGLAMRFTSSMSKADYAALAELGTVDLGMLITPAAYVAKAGAFTKEALDDLGAANGAYVDVDVTGYYEATETDYIFAGSLKGFSASTLAKNPDFAAILYATVTTEAGDVFTVYGDFNFDANQDVKSVATGLSTSADLTDTEKGWLTTLVGKFTA